jgi:hypothetical protein
MGIRTLNRSFAGGEITPELFGRIDLLKYQTGLKKALNFEILPHGPATNRTGFEYVLETKFSTKKSVLLPFIYNTSQTYQLEFGDFYVRFHTNNGTVLNAAQAVTGATNANPGVFTRAAHGYSNGNWLFCSGFTGGWAVLNGRFLIVQNVTANTWTLTDLAGVNIDTSAFGAFAAGSVASVYEVASPYAATDLFDANGALWLHITQSNDVFTIVHPLYQARELKRSGPTSWAFNLVTVVPTQVAPTAPVATPTLGGAVNYTYAVTAIAAGTLEESVQTVDATCANDLTIAGHFNTITWTDAAGAVRYNVYKKINGLYGFIGQGAAGAAGVVDSNITPNVSVTPPIANDPISAANDYPSGVGYYQGRRWFGGSNNKPLRLSATRSGTESNMSYSIPTQANDSITVNLTARQNSTIRHIVPLSDLLLLTSGAEWVVQSSDTGPITPATVNARPQDYIGASNVPPVVTAGAILYPQDRGGRVRELSFQWQQQGWRSADASIMAPHLFDSYTLTGSGYVRAPSSSAWFTRSDGYLLGCTYVPEQQVLAWHQHNTQGTFENICVTPEGTEDVLYAITNRTLNGRTVRSVERKRTRLFGTLPFAFFVDCGLTYNGAPATVISGLWHLVGMTVSILADGAVLPPQVVSAAGTITLDTAASVVHVGLSYIADFETLPLAMEQVMAMAQGLQKNVNEVRIRVNNTSGVYAGPSTSKLTPMKTRTTEPYGSPPAMVSGTYRIVITPSWNADATLCVRQSDPLPVTILSMTLDTEQGG